MSWLKKLLDRNGDRSNVRAWVQELEQEHQLIIKNLSFDKIEYSDKILVSDDENPAFDYLQSQYSLNIEPYSRVADLLNEVAGASALQLASLNSTRANDYLVHYFFDLYLALNTKLLSSDGDIVSASIDGMHLRYFGQPSQKVITSSIQLLAEKEKCFLRSFFSILKEDDFPRMLGSFAFYCLTNEMVRASECLTLAKQILEMIKHVSPRLEKEIKGSVRR